MCDAVLPALQHRRMWAVRAFQVVALMPFLTIDPASRRQRFLRGVAAYPRCMGAVAGALGLLPFWLKVCECHCITCVLVQHH